MISAIVDPITPSKSAVAPPTDSRNAAGDAPVNQGSGFPIPIFGVTVSYSSSISILLENPACRELDGPYANAMAVCVCPT